jgi:hypothetical protein
MRLLVTLFIFISGGFRSFENFYNYIGVFLIERGARLYTFLSDLFKLLINFNKYFYIQFMKILTFKN